jgi:hypothetical protein
LAFPSHGQVLEIERDIEHVLYSLQDPASSWGCNVYIKSKVKQMELINMEGIKVEDERAWCGNRGDGSSWCR